MPPDDRATKDEPAHEADAERDEDSDVGGCPSPVASAESERRKQEALPLQPTEACIDDQAETDDGGHDEQGGGDGLYPTVAAGGPVQVAVGVVVTTKRQIG